MSTRLKRPPFWRHLLVTLILMSVGVYLGYSVLSGQFGIESREALESDIGELTAQSSALAAEVDSFRHRIDLFKSSSLDPDIVSERARALLAMSEPDDIVVMVDPVSGKSISGLSLKSTDIGLTKETPVNPID